MMSTAVKDEIETMAELIELRERLGGIPPERLLLRPTPGEATEDDLLAQERKGRLCELVDGTLVEKAMGRGQSFIAGWMVQCLAVYVGPRDLGYFCGGDGFVRLRERTVRAPDFSFFRKERMPNGQFDMTPIGDLIPDLAVEVISAGNTKAEIERKTGEYFDAGVEAVWVVDPFRRVVEVYTSADDFVTLKEADTLEGSPTFPGLDLPLERIFELVPPTKKRARRRKP